MKKHNKILLVSPEYPPPLIGGSLVYVHNLIEYSELKYTILTEQNGRSNSNNLTYIESRWLVNSRNPSNFNLLTMYLFILMYLLKNISKYDLIILNMSAIGNGFFAFFLGVLNQKSLIISFAEELTLALKAKGIKGSLKRLCLKGYRSANMNISVSNFAKKVLIEKLKVRTPIHVIPTPLHDSKIDYKNSKSVIREGIISVGRLVERKGHILVLKAFKDLLKELPNKRLTIIGDGPEYTNIMSYITKNSLSHLVSIHRKVSDKFLSKQYRQHEIFILANLMLENGDCEGAPNVLIEAAAHGLPSIAGEEGGTSDVVEHNKTGVLLDPRNTENLTTVMVDLLNDKTKLSTMRENGILKVKLDHNKEKAGIKCKNYILACIGR